MIRLSTEPNNMDWPFLQYAKFTTDGHSIILIQNYDIYYRRGPTEKVFRVTFDAIPGVVQNGIPDWLYRGRKSLFSIKSSIKWKSVGVSIELNMNQYANGFIYLCQVLAEWLHCARKQVGNGSLKNLIFSKQGINGYNTRHTRCLINE